MNHTQRIVNRRATIRSIHSNLDSAWFAMYDLLDYPTIYQPITLKPQAIERARIERSILQWLESVVHCAIPCVAMALGFIVPLLVASL